MTNPTESLPNEPAPVKAWPAGRLAAAVSTVLWRFMALIGISGIEGIRDQHVPGYPNDGQLRLYVVVPLIGLAGSGAILGFAKRLPSWARGIGMGISFFALLLVFMTFGGGV
jgi:hypothetical protein